MFARVIVIGLMIGTAARAAPPQAVQDALIDARKLDPVACQRTRYLDLSNIEAEHLQTARQVISFHCNSLSREAEITKPREVTPTLLAIVLDDYSWIPEVYGRLGHDVKTAEPFFHVTIETGKVREQAAAPWLGQAITELINRCQSQVPIIRGDWFVFQTGIQADRNGHGYYDFLALGHKEKDFQALIGAEPALARKLKKEMAAAVARSGVTLNNRSIARMQAITGAYWFTQDFKASKDKQNTVRLLDFSTEPPKGDASEQYGTLPNGLFAFWLQNGDGARQDTAPDFIASDGKSHSTDRRVHVGLSCIRCHTPGIQPIDDHARRLFQGEIKLVSPDYDKLKRLRQLYLSDLPRQIQRDQTDYADAVRKCNGLSAEANATAYGKFWARYDADLTALDCARELGCHPAKLMEALRAYGPNLDPVLAGLLQKPAIPIRREHWEEVYHIAQVAMGRVAQ